MADLFLMSRELQCNLHKILNKTVILWREVESCHVSSGGISWRSVSVYRHKIFIYHFTACIKDEI